MSQPAPDTNLVRENATCAHHSPDPLTDLSAEENEVTANVPPSPCPENSVCALCGISIAPLDPTTESPDQLTRVRHAPTTLLLVVMLPFTMCVRTMEMLLPLLLVVGPLVSSPLREVLMAVMTSMPMIMLGSTSGLKTEGMLLDFGLLRAKLAHRRAGFGVTLLALERRVRTNFQLMERLLPEMASLRTRRTNTGVWPA
jgi:hypothetical protein